MKRTSTFLSIAVLALGLTARTALAQGVPQTMSFTARVYDGESPVTGPVALTFELFDAADGGTLIWDEKLTAEADDGLVYATMGSENGLTAAVFDGSQRFLQLTVNGDVQSPRIPLLSVPYATRAAVAETAKSAETAARIGMLGPDDIVTGVTAGDGLSGGGAGGDVAVSVDPGYVQRRVSGECPAGSLMKKINVDGSVECQVVDAAPGTFTVQVNAMTCTRENGAPRIDVCTGSGHVRTDGDSAFPCAVGSSSVRDTYLCNLNLPDGALLEEIVVHCYDNSSDGYCEGSVWRSLWSSSASAAISPTYRGTWQNSGVTAAPSGVSFPIYTSADPPHVVDADGHRYLVGLGIKGPAETVQLYGFHARYRIP